MTQSFLDGYSRNLVEALFREQDERLLVAFRERMERVDRRTQLAQVCGVDDEALLDHLIDLEVTPETLAAIAVVPLVIVAWSDGVIQEKERNAIMRAAEETGVPPQDGRYPVLEYWLSEQPGPELFETWKAYIAALCRQLSEKEIDELKHDLLDRAEAVAKAAGSLLGLGKNISAKERDALASLEEPFAQS